MIKIIDEYKKYSFVYDKTTQSYLNLPYEEDKVLIAPNDFVRSQLLNKKLYYLHYNFLFLYKLCNFADFSIPKTSLFSFSGNNFNLFEENFRKNVATSNTELVQSEKAAVSYNISTRGGTIIFYNTDKELIAASINRSRVQILAKTSFIDPLSGSIIFDNISDVKTNKNGDLYLVDNGYKNIYYYNVGPVLRGDGIYRKLPFLRNVIGGPGPAYENSKFNNINNIAINLRYVVVEDDINACFKLLDKDLNWLNTIPLKNLFNKIGRFSSLAIDEHDKIFGVAGTELYEFEIEKDYSIRLKKIYDASSYLYPNEKVLNIYFSQQDPLVFYMFTNRAIKKVWSTDPTGCIGEYVLDNEVLWGAGFYNSETEDTLILKTKAPSDINNIKILGFNDILDITSILTNRNFNIYGFDEIEVKPDEYTSNWVFQKAVKKIYFNLISLLKQVKYRLVEDNNELSIIIDRIYNKTFLNYAYPFEDPYNINIGLNEVFQSEVVNRLLTELLLLQRTVLLYFINNKQLKVYYSPAPQRRIKNVISYVYYGDESVNTNPSPIKLQPLEELIPLDGFVISLGGAPYLPGEGISITEGVSN